MNIEPTIDEIRKMGDAKRPPPKKISKPRVSKKQVALPLPPPPEPEPEIDIEDEDEDEDDEEEEEIIIPVKKATKSKVQPKEVNKNHIGIIKYLIDNCDKNNKKELDELKSYITSQQKNIIEAFNEKLAESLPKTKPKPVPKKDATTSKPKKDTKPKTSRKTLDLTVSDKEISEIINPPPNQKPSAAVDTKLQAFLDAFKR